MQEVDEIVAELSRPLPFLQQVRGWHNGNGGWTEDSRREWLHRLSDLRWRLAAGESLREAEGEYVLALDHWGVIGGGELHLAILRLGEQVGRLRRQERSGARSSLPERAD